MSRQSFSLAQRLARRFLALDATRQRVEALVAGNMLTRRAAEQMYEGLFLSAYTAFEGFLEELFTGLLLSSDGLASSRRDVVPRIAVRSHRVAREVLHVPDRKYIDWLPYKYTLALAQRFLRGGRPFTNLSNTQKEHLTKCVTVRNVIAHKSRHSFKKFDQQVIAGAPIPPIEKSPAGFLRGLFRISPAQTRYENFVSRLLEIAQFLAT